MNTRQMLDSSIIQDYFCLNNVFVLSQDEYAWSFGSVNFLSLQRHSNPRDPDSRLHGNLHKVTVPIEIPDSSQLNESLLVRLRDYIF